MTAANGNRSSPLEKLLQRLSRQFSSHVASQRPPDSAAAALGRELGRHVSLQDEAVLWRALIRAAEFMPPSVPHAFFAVIMDRMRGDMTLSFEWVPRWILQTEETIRKGPSSNRSASSTEPSSGLRHLLDACIRAYSFYLVTHQQQQLLSEKNNSIRNGHGGEQEDEDLMSTSMAQQQQQQQQSILDIYRRLKLESSRRYLLRAVLNVAFQQHRELVGCCVPILLSPFLVVSVLDNNSDRDNDNNKSAALDMFNRSIWTVWAEPDVSEEDCFAIMDWMTAALSIHLDVNAGAVPAAAAHRGEDSIMSAVSSAMALAESWLVELCFLAQALYRRVPKGRDHQDNDPHILELLDEWVGSILYDTVPRILGVCNYSDQTPMVEGIYSLLSLTSPRFGVDAATALRLTVAVFLVANPNDRNRLLELLRHGQLRPKNRAALSILRSLACVLVQDEGSRDAALRLREKLDGDCRSVEEYAARDYGNASRSTSRAGNLIQLLERGDSETNGLINGIATLCQFKDAQLSAAQQISALFFGIYLLDQDYVRGRSDRGFCFLSNLLIHAPHLGISLLPVVMDHVNRASKNGNGEQLLRYLEFLCTSLARDPHCAQELWFWMSGKLQADTQLRVAVIRLLPKLCEANSRLYRRVIDFVEQAVTHRQPEIRLAVAATLVDLSRNDQIRDVSDVIGWIQGLLTEERLTPAHSLLVHCAITSLHHLVVAEELDFDVVIKVLNKRLCSVSDFDSVLVLPSVIQEALVLLLGDGECDSGSDSDEDGDEEGPAVVTVSPQVSSSVRTLVRLGASLLELPTLDLDQVRTLENIFTSLSNYSLEALGLSEEGIQAVIASSESAGESPALSSEAGKKYVALRDLVVGSMKISFDTKEAERDPRVLLARKMLEFEEETIGSLLWKKHSARNQADKARTKKTKQTQSSISVLPEVSEISGLASTRPSSSSSAAAIAILMSCDGTNVSIIRDNGDASLESSDPLFIVFVVQAYLHAAVSLVSKTANEEIAGMLSEIRSWNQVFISPDTMYLSISAISMYIPHDLHDKPNTTNISIVEDVFNVVLEAFKSNRFENDIIRKISLALAAVSTLRSGSIQHVVDTVETLEQSVRAFGGRKCFGAYYGLALVCQALQNYFDIEALEHVFEGFRMTIFRICGFLVEELLSCYEERSDIFDTLVSCLKNGAATANLVESMSELDINSISLFMTKHVQARYLFISCGMCLPGLSALNGALHLATLRLLESFEWGGGKGLVLPPMLRACRETNLFDEEELKQIYTSFAETYEEKIEGGEDLIVDSDGLDDLFFALNCTSTKPSSPLIRRSLVGNKNLFDEDGRVLSLVAIVVAVVKIPSLSGTSYFAAQPELSSEAEKNDVKNIVGIVREAVSSDESTFSGMGMILFAMLASMKHQPDLNAAAVQQTMMSAEATNSPKNRGEEDGPALDFEKIPTPKRGTVLAGLFRDIEVRVETPSPKGQLYLTRALSTLECLSLPDPFSKYFLEPLMQLAKDDSVLLASASLLCSQVRGRRRAVFSGSDFVQFALSLSNCAPERWNRGCLKIFVEKLPAMMKKLPPESSALTVEQVWCSCLAALGDDSSLVVSFLTSARQLVMTTALSPTTVKAIRSVVARVAKDIPEYPLFMLTSKPNKDTPSILESYTLCLQQMEREAIDEDDHVKLNSMDGFDHEVVKVFSLIALIKLDYFSSTEKETAGLSRCASWISKKLQLPNEQVDYYALRQIIIAYTAAVTTKESNAKKKDRLSSLLEVLLLTNKKASSRIGFEWIAVSMANWCDHPGSDAEVTLGFLCTGASPDLPHTLSAKDLDDYFQVLIEDLPYNLAVFSFQQKISPSISNQLYRLLVHWSELDVVDNDILDCIRKAIFSCQNGGERGYSSNLFTSLASSTLSAQRIHGGGGTSSSSLLESRISDLEE